MMSMFGSVTDAQVFSRELSDQEMMDMTGCRNFLTGDILSWESETWNLTTPWNSSEMEILDFEKDVCSNPEVKYTSLFILHSLVPTERLPPDPSQTGL